MPEPSTDIVPPARANNDGAGSLPLHPLINILLIIKNIALIMIGSYGLSQSIHIILRYMVGERSTVVAFFNTFAHMMWMPALILLPLLLIVKQRRIAMMMVLPAVMFIGNYGVVFLPRPTTTVSAASHTLTIQTQNLLARNRTRERIPEIINDISADIVALQEVSSDFAELLQPLDKYPYKAIHGAANDPSQNQRETMGQAILSKYPILEDTYWSYDFLSLPLGHQRVVIDVEGQHIVIYNVHPTHPGMTGHAFFDPSQRRREIADLLQRIESETLPVLMLGDFNLTDLSSEYSQITETLTDTYRTVGYGMGFSFPDMREANVLDSLRILPENFPDHLPTPLFLRLDYVFHSEEFIGVNAYIHHTSGGSDHRPLVVELALGD